ncbi:unnamed protein product [Clonostachys solani]|uniref:Uncharacterized protein n=1 Tax=Clonostachys solani TaxID=160281 RepID=A0A9N9ZP32_9HYPO|nr:unnamed protein product [Clonostachys solani]
MGLPLFVAPVESDVLPKPPAKARRSASPPRSAIRRAPYVNVRDRAALSRRSRLLDLQERRRPISRTLETALTTDTTSSGIAAAAEYIRNGVVTSDDLARPDMSDRESRRLAALEALNRDREEDNNTRQDSRTQWWMLHPQAQSRRENIIMLGMERMRSRNRSRGPQVERLSAAGRMMRNAGSNLPTAREAETLASSTRRRPTDDVNGLGDRNRSISPEGWDTLLSTLTPDPQPPSANSSFMSTVISQNPSTSFTSASGQTLRPGTAPEPPCESGCENSDTEDGEAPPRRRHHVSRPPYRSAHPVRFEVPGLDYPLTGDDYVTRGQPPRPRDPLTPREGPSLRSDNGSINVYMARPTLLGSQRDGWVGSLSVGATEDGSGSEPSRLNAEGSFMSTGSTNSADEDLVSLQRIVRRLASRDDIPEEWWTETGLSRTLTRDRP